MKLLLLLSCVALAIGNTAGPMLLRFYFLHGGSRLWLSTWLQTAGFPLLAIPLCFSYVKNPNTENHLSHNLFITSCALGILSGLINYMYAWGASYLPVSTSSLLAATQLGFNAAFAFFIVRQKFTPYSMNSVIMLTMGSVLLAFHTSADRPPGVSRGKYVLGFLVTISSSALSGLFQPLIELARKRTNIRKITYTLIMEMQFVSSFVATVLCTVGMIVKKDFQAIPREARASDAGQVGYYMCLVWVPICFELAFIGMFGVVSLSNALLSGVISTVCISVTEVFGVIFYKEKFSGEKGMALAMALWGFASYLYGERRDSIKQKRGRIEEESKPITNSEKQVCSVELIVQQSASTPGCQGACG